MQTTQSPARSGVVITGPQGSGKTRHAEALRAHFGLTHILDDESWHTADPIPDDTLVLTNEHAPEGIAIAAALAALQSPGANRGHVHSRPVSVRLPYERRATRFWPYAAAPIVITKDALAALQWDHSDRLNAWLAADPASGDALPPTPLPQRSLRSESPSGLLSSLPTSPGDQRVKMNELEMQASLEKLRAEWRQRAQQAMWNAERCCKSCKQIFNAEAVTYITAGREIKALLRLAGRA